MVTPSHGLAYPSTAHVRNALRKVGLRQAAAQMPVAVDCAFMDTLDYIAAKVRVFIDIFRCRLYYF